LNDLAKNVILWIIIAVVLLSVFNSFGPNSQRLAPVPYSTFLSWVKDGSVKEVVFEGEAIRGGRSNGEPFVTYNPETQNTALIGELQQHSTGAVVSGRHNTSGTETGHGQIQRATSRRV